MLRSRNEMSRLDLMKLLAELTTVSAIECRLLYNDYLAVSYDYVMLAYVTVLLALCNS
jgi:hypothetical protein